MNERLTKIEATITTVQSWMANIEAKLTDPLVKKEEKEKMVQAYKDHKRDTNQPTKATGM